METRTYQFNGSLGSEDGVGTRITAFVSGWTRRRLPSVLFRVFSLQDSSACGSSAGAIISSSWTAMAEGTQSYEKRRQLLDRLPRAWRLEERLDSVSRIWHLLKLVRQAG